MGYFFWGTPCRKLPRLPAACLKFIKVESKMFDLWRLIMQPCSLGSNFQKTFQFVQNRNDPLHFVSVIGDQKRCFQLSSGQWRLIIFKKSGEVLCRRKCWKLTKEFFGKKVFVFDFQILSIQIFIAVLSQSWCLAIIIILKYLAASILVREEQEFCIRIQRWQQK